MPVYEQVNFEVLLVESFWSIAATTEVAINLLQQSKCKDTTS